MNGIVIETLGSENGEAWDDFVVSHGGGPMHWAAWSHILSDAFAVEPIFLLARAEDGEVRGLLPLYSGNGILTGGQLASMPDGILAGDDDTAEALLARALEEAAARHASSVVIRGGLPAGAQPAATVEVVHTVVETAGPPEQTWRALKKKVRWAVRQNEHLTFSDSEDAADLTAFYRLYADHQQRLGTPATGRSLLKAMRYRLGDRMKLFTVKDETRMLGGMIAVRNGVGWSSLYAAQAARARDDDVGYFLYWKVLEWMSRNGVASFDLGRSTPGGGVHRFKQKWGGGDVTKAYGYYGQRGEAMASSAGRIRDGGSAMQRAWRLLPRPVARAVGPLVRRQFPFS